MALYNDLFSILENGDMEEKKSDSSGAEEANKKESLFGSIANTGSFVAPLIDAATTDRHGKQGAGSAGVSGALGGALKGASTGAAGGPIGAIAGGAIGLIGGAISGIFGAKKRNEILHANNNVAQKKTQFKSLYKDIARNQEINEADRAGDALIQTGFSSSLPSLG